MRYYPPIEVRLAAGCRLDPVTGCVNWLGLKSPSGYGRIWWNGRGRETHSVAYELAHGAPDSGLQLDHLCRNRACCNVLHLEPVTPRENALRGVSFAAINAAKSHCLRGHELSGANVRMYRGSRVCRQCELISGRQKYLNRKVRDESARTETLAARVSGDGRDRGRVAQSSR